MKLVNIVLIALIAFITLTSSIKAESNKLLIKKLKQGNNLIFIRHAYAPGGGDPKNFDINDCSTQRNLNYIGKRQANKIGEFFIKNQIPFDKVYSSGWCRCKDTASIAFKKFEIKKFLNSFFSKKFYKNKNEQIKSLKEYVKNSESSKNLIFVTHYVVIFELFNIHPASGEIIIANKNLTIISRIETNN